MKKLLLILLFGFASWLHILADVQPVVDLVTRVCGQDAAQHFTFKLDQNLKAGQEAFKLGYEGDKVTVTGTSLSALTTGLNWYLKHDAHVHISWNNLTETPKSYPQPKDQNVHTTNSTYRYYLNYCTFSYSMSMWNEDRWMKEIDWMALHGINLPLQIVGMDAVWYKMLTEDFKFTHEEANAFIVGPAFQGWWLMNNIVALGGPNPQWWYNRSADLGKKIVQRMLALGMKPCLPGFVGMAPRKYVQDKGAQAFQMDWNRIQSPDILNPSETTAFNELAEKYYSRIKQVFGFNPTHYSLDPIHEHDLPGGMTQDDYKKLCDIARTAMDTWGVAKGQKGTWVAQEWQVNADHHRINALPVENTLLLDLSSERLTYVDRFGNHKYLFCMLHNYGGNIGLYGRIADMLKRYQDHKTQHSQILSGVGATPEGIETNPVLYDLLFELPWMEHVPDAKTWLHDYTLCRYDMDSPEAKEAWDNLLVTVYQDEDDHQQGCREPVFCAVPNLEGNGASAWAGATFDWDKSKVIRAAFKMLEMNGNNANYTYDMVDIVRQALSDYGHTLQMDMKQTSINEGYQSDRFAKQSDAFLQLIDDLDGFLGTLPDFRVGRFTEDARKIAVENKDNNNQDWMEHNIRMLFTTWGEKREIIDYANREYQGMMADYYKPRWELYFNDLKQNSHCGRDWFNEVEGPWMRGEKTGAPYGKYTATAVNTTHGDAKATAKALMEKYIGVAADGSYYTAYTTNDLRNQIKVAVNTTEDLKKVIKTMHTNATIASYAIDADCDGKLDAEQNMTDGMKLPEMAARDALARITFSDGTRILFTATIGKELEKGRLVCASVNDQTLGDVRIEGTAKNGTFSKGGVAMHAECKANANALFIGWMKQDGSFAAHANPFVYVGATSESFQAYFTRDSWKKPESAEKGMDETKQHSAYVTSFEYQVNNGEFQTLYTTQTVPTQLYTRISTPIVAKPGDKITIRWKAADGLKYCFLTAYADETSYMDGKFETCVGTKGQYGQQCGELLNGTLEYNVGSTVSKPVTTLRLRFDGAWNEANWDSANNRFHAEGVTNRPVYDISIVTPQAEATPVFDRFSCDGWEVACKEKNNKHIALTGAWATNGEQTLKVPATVTGKPLGKNQAEATYHVDNLEDNFFEGNETMKAVELPATLQKIGHEPVYTSVAKNLGGQQQTLNLNTTLTEDGWSIQTDVKMPAASLNTWGSCVLASGSNPFDGPFNEGFQLYYYAPSHPEGKQGLCIKTSVGETILGPSDIFEMYGKEVAIELSYQNGKLTSRFASEGKQAEKVISCTIKNVQQLCWGMQSDASFHDIRYSHEIASAPEHAIIAQGKALQTITVAEGNKHYSSHDGVLYTPNHAKLLAMPVARTEKHQLPADVKDIEAAALKANEKVLLGVTPEIFETLKQGGKLTAARSAVGLSQNWDKSQADAAFGKLGKEAFGEVSIPDRVPFATKWNTLCLPVTLSEAEARALFAETYALSEVVTKEDGNVTLKFAPAQAADLQAGMPLLVKMADNAALTFKNKSLQNEAKTKKAEDNNYCAEMTANMDFKIVKDGEYIIKDNLFYVADAAANLRGYRAYIRLTSKQPALQAPRLLDITTDQSVTGVDHVTVEVTDGNGKTIYTLDGKRIDPRRATKGIFIENNKKVIR